MTLSRNLRRNLTPFETANDHFFLLPPNRFAVQICDRRAIYRERKRVGWKYTPLGNWVIGTLNQRISEPVKFSMSEAMMGCRALSYGLNAVEVEGSPSGDLSGLNVVRSTDPAVRCTLTRQSVILLRRLARGFGVKVNKRTVPPKLTLAAREGQVHLTLSAVNGLSKFVLTTDAEVISPITRTIEPKCLKHLCVDDYDVTLGTDGVLEMIGIESGLVFLIATRP